MHNNSNINSVNNYQFSFQKFSNKKSLMLCFDLEYVMSDLLEKKHEYIYRYLIDQAEE